MKFGLNELSVLIAATYLGNANAELLKVNLGKDKLAKRNINESYAEPVKQLFAGEVSLGSPEQKLQVQFDTGSYTFAANYKNSALCQDNDACAQTGTYDPSVSSSSVNTSRPYTARYEDGASGYGHYFNDTFHINGLTVNDYKFGLMEYSTSSMNVMGLALINGDESAPIFMNFLYDSGIISRRIFSTYYSTSGDSGAIVIGGLDQSKYSGTLEKVPVTMYNQFTVPLTGVSTDCGDVNTNGYQILLDTGSGANSLPDALYHQLHQAIGGVITKVPIQSFTSGPTGEITENYVLKCANAKPFKFDFTGKKITIHPQDYLISLYEGNSPLVDSDGDDLCTTTFFNGGSPDSQEAFVLGSNILKTLFLVWDADNAEVAIAELADSNNEDLVEITGDIPNAVKASNYDTPNSATTDTYYPSPSTVSLSATTILTSGFYTGTFSTDSCTSTSSTSPSSSSSFSSSVSGTKGHSSIYSTVSTGTCLQCSSGSSSLPSATGITSSASSSASSSDISSASSSGFSFSETTSVAPIASSSSNSVESIPTESKPVASAYKDTPAVSTFIERDNSTVIKTITSCSDNACSKVTLTSVFSPAFATAPDTVSVTDVSSSVSSAPSSELLSSGFSAIDAEQSSQSVLVESSAVSSEVPSLSSGQSTVAVETSTKSISSKKEEVSSTEVPSTPTSSASSSSAPSSSTSGSLTPIITTSSAILSLSKSLSTEKDSTITVQTHVTVSQQSTVSQYNSSSTGISTYAAISTYEGGSNSIVIPGFFKFFSSLF